MIQTIKLDGKNHPARFNFRAIKKMKELLGKNPLEVFTEGLTGDDFEKIEVLVFGCIYAGYKSEKQECPIVFEDMQDLMNISDLPKYMELLQVDAGADEKKKLSPVKKK